MGGFAENLFTRHDKKYLACQSSLKLVCMEQCFVKSK